MTSLVRDGDLAAFPALRWRTIPEHVTCFSLILGAHRCSVADADASLRDEKEARTTVIEQRGSMDEAHHIRFDHY